MPFPCVRSRRGPIVAEVVVVELRSQDDRRQKKPVNVALRDHEPDRALQGRVPLAPLISSLFCRYVVTSCQLPGCYADEAENGLRSVHSSVDSAGKQS